MLKAYFDMLNHLGVTHTCDRWIDRPSRSKYAAKNVYAIIL